MKATLTLDDIKTDVCTVVEAGQILGLQKSAAYAAAGRGDIPTLRIGGRILVPVARLRKLLEG